MNEAVYHSLCAILEYMYEDEERHWEESGKPKTHIFNDVVRVQEWADEVAGKLP